MDALDIVFFERLETETKRNGKEWSGMEWSGVEWLQLARVKVMVTAKKRYAIVLGQSVTILQFPALPSSNNKKPYNC